MIFEDAVEARCSGVGVSEDEVQQRGVGCADKQRVPLPRLALRDLGSHARALAPFSGLERNVDEALGLLLGLDLVPENRQVAELPHFVD